MRLTIFLLLIITFTGCVGISSVTSSEKERNTILDKERGFLSYGESKIYSKEEVISLWGEPDNKALDNNLEYWIYNRYVAWSGIVIWVIVPIPLLVPIGYRETTLIFKNEVTIGALSEHVTWPMYICTPLNGFMDRGLCTFYD